MLHNIMKQVINACKETLLQEYVVAIKNCELKKFRVDGKMTTFLFLHKPDGRKFWIVLDESCELHFCSDDKKSYKYWKELNESFKLK